MNIIELLNKYNIIYYSFVMFFLIINVYFNQHIKPHLLIMIMICSLWCVIFSNNIFFQPVNNVAVHYWQLTSIITIGQPSPNTLASAYPCSVCWSSVCVLVYFSIWKYLVTLPGIIHVKPLVQRGSGLVQYTATLTLLYQQQTLAIVSAFGY